MAEHIVLSKAESQSWGFRLTGGLDFGTPLTVIKVNKDSVAEREGLKVGDMFLAIDDVPLVQMTHAQATDHVVKAGNRFKVTVVRGSFDLPPQLVQGPKPPEEDAAAPPPAPIVDPPLDLPDLPPLLATIINDGLNEQLVDDGTFTEVTPPVPVLVQVQVEVVDEATPAAAEATPEAPHVEYTEEEIAEMMSGCAEVLMGTCIGVDFQKLPPDTDIMKSEVLQLLVAEKCGKPAKKLSAFNQRPNRPVPKVTGAPDAPKIPYYPMKYVPQKKKEEPVDEPVQEQVPLIEEPAEPQEPRPQATVEEPAQEPIVELAETPEPQEGGGQEQEHTEILDTIDEAVLEQQDTNDIESQLAEIQRQLTEIVQLPIAIQEHLTFIQQQLAKILALRAAEAAENQEEIVEEPQHQEEEEPPSQEVIEPEVKEEEAVPEVVEELVQEPIVEEPKPEPEPEPVPEPVESAHKKDIEWKKEEFEYKRNKPFFPLTPQPRPVQLPGGRKWFAPKDVYTEDFIAATLSGNEEVIRGTTIGVDFHKFERSYDHLKTSSVYKMVHDADAGDGDRKKRATPASFANKTEKDHAAADYVTASTEPPTSG